jgi:hypothetical protein
MRNAYKFVVRKPEWKRTFGRPRRKLKGNIEVDSEELDYVDIYHVCFHIRDL